MRFLHPEHQSGRVCFEDRQAEIVDGVVNVPEAFGRANGWIPAPAPKDPPKEKDKTKTDPVEIAALTLETAGKVVEVNADRAVDLIGAVTSADVLAAIEVAEKANKKTKDGRKSVLEAVTARFEALTNPATDQAPAPKDPPKDGE